MKFKKFDKLSELEEKGIDKTTKCMIVRKPEEVLIAEEHMNKVHGNDIYRHFKTNLPRNCQQKWSKVGKILKNWRNEI